MILLLLSGIAAPVAAHASDVPHLEDGPATQPATDETAPPAVGYTGPGRQPYVNFFDGAWFYGRVSATPVGDQMPYNIHGSGDWLVWEDTMRGDIYAYNVPAGSGMYVTSDRAFQRNPSISNGVVVWEDYRNSTHADVYAYFLETGETRRVSSGPGNHHHPNIRGDLIVWEDDRDRNGDIWAYSLANETQFPVHVGPDRESDPVVVGSKVFFRTYRFNVWDILGVDTETGEEIQVTSDTEINGAPFTNGEDLFFLSQFFTAWKLDRYDVDDYELKTTGFKFQDTTRLAVSGDHLVAAVRDNLNRQLVADNLTTGDSTHVTGSMPLISDVYLEGRTVYGVVRTAKGNAMLAIELSTFAFSRRPSMDILSPRNGIAWLQPVVFEGLVTADAAWSDPATFTYRIDDGPPQAIPYASRFRVTLDPQGVEPGRHQVTIRATYREGPPTERSLLLVVPRTGTEVDIAESAAAWHAARVFSTLNLWLFDNPASYAVIVLLLCFVVVVGVRVWLIVKPKTERAKVTYVPPDDG